MEKIQKLIEKYGAEAYTKLKDPIFFIEEIIGMKLTEYQKEWIHLIENNKRLNITAFRQSGKTEALFVCYPIFKAFTQAGWIGIIISCSMPQAMEVIRRIKDKILDNEVLRTSIPDLRSADWSKTQLELKNGSRIICKPCNPNIRGYFADFVGGDEIGEWKDEDIVTKAIPPLVLSRDGTICFIGTPISKIDMIHKLRRNKAYISKIYPANLKAGDGTLWSQRYPKMLINLKRKEYDSLSWSREFLCEPLSSKDRVYPYELVCKSFDYEAEFSTVKNGESAYYMGLDFALSGEAGSDYTVYTILEKKGDICRMVNMERYKGLSYQAQKMRIKNLCDTYKPVRVMLDEGSFGKSFLSDLLQMFIPAEGFRFTNQSKQDLHTNLRNFFEQNHLIINKNKDDIKTRDITDKLVVELSNFGVIFDEKKGTVKFEGLGEHDDMVTSLALSCWGARSLGNLSWNISRGTSKKSSSIFYLGSVN